MLYEVLILPNCSTFLCVNSHSEFISHVKLHDIVSRHAFGEVEFHLVNENTLERIDSLGIQDVYDQMSKYTESVIDEKINNRDNITVTFIEDTNGEFEFLNKT